METFLQYFVLSHNINIHVQSVLGCVLHVLFRWHFVEMVARTHRTRVDPSQDILVQFALNDQVGPAQDLLLLQRGTHRQIFRQSQRKGVRVHLKNTQLIDTPPKLRAVMIMIKMKKKEENGISPHTNICCYT